MCAGNVKKCVLFEGSSSLFNSDEKHVATYQRLTNNLHIIYLVETTQRAASRQHHLLVYKKLATTYSTPA
jgi:hypothetical protein